MPGHRDAVINNVQSTDACEKICLEFTTWVCKAVEYDAMTKKCTLSGMNREQSALVQGVQGKEEQIMYFEWLCKAGMIDVHVYIHIMSGQYNIAIIPVQVNYYLIV